MLFVFGDYAFYNLGIYINFNPNAKIDTFTTTKDKKILLSKNGNAFEEFEIKGIDMGVGIPGHFATEYSINKETYLRWFKMIQEMGANCIRVYTILHTDFYDALYEYNINNDNPLYVIHGLWLNDYVQNSHRDAYNKDFLNKMKHDARILVDVIHGNRRVNIGTGISAQKYKHDISDWVIGYILGVEWEDVTVAFTNDMKSALNSYDGSYMYTTEDASAFEAVLAQIGDSIIAYETNRYNQQRLVAFSNWPTTDPLDYPEKIEEFFLKIAKVDVEHIKTTDRFISGTFASYHIYPYYPDYLSFYDFIGEEINNKEKFVDENGVFNSYRAYLSLINEYHSIPVVISEYGVPTSRGMAQKDRNTGRAQGRMSEADQGKAIVECYEDIMAAGCAGSVLFTWQDEWFKRTWNTMHYVDLTRTPYWSDYQTNEQYFGILSFDPGKEKSVCYVDGNKDEWSESDIVTTNEDMSLSMKYDEKFIYFLVRKDNLNLDNDKIYIPIDITPKSGSNYCENYNIKFENTSDFVVAIDGKYNTRVVVQDRYEALKAVYWKEINVQDPYVYTPSENSPKFVPINLILQVATNIQFGETNQLSEIYETGLLTYGNANPKSEDYNSLADFMAGEDYIEIKIPWQMLNFSDPSTMKIHDDYYKNYGIENLKINKMYVGIGSDATKSKRIPMNHIELKGWGKKPTYHERLKSSYYVIKNLWSTTND